MKKIIKPLFITFEGCEGSGKSTQAAMLCEYLSSRNIPFIKTREIGGTVEAEKIREILLYSDILPMSELLLAVAARFEHVNKVIIPALKEGKWVVCDRFVDSTAVYQGFAQNLGLDFIYELHDKIMNSILPDITFFMDIPPEIGIPRTLNREGNNKFEDKDIEFHKTIYNGFKLVSEKFKDRIVKIDSIDLDIEQIHKIIIKILF